MNLWVLLWSRPTKVAATVGLTILSVRLTVLSISEEPRPWFILAWFLAGFIVLHEVVQYVRDNRSSLRGKEMQDRMLRLIADLSELAGGRYDIWVTDIYIPKYDAMRLNFRVVTLVRELTMALKNVREIPREVDAGNPLFGDSFRQKERRFWWDKDVVQIESDVSNQWCKLTSQENRKLSRRYGAISINPIVDSLRSDCRGLLVVHVARDPEISTTAAGVFSQEGGQLRLSEACNDIHGVLRDKTRQS